MKKTKKKKSKFLLIKGTVYPFDILVSTATYEETIAYLERLCQLDDEEKEKLEMSGNGRTVMLRGGQTIVRVRPDKTQIGFSLATMVHELLHAVNFIFDRIGYVPKADNDESQTYYLEYLVREVLLHYR